MLSNNIILEDTTFLKQLCNDIKSYYEINKQEISLYNYISLFINQLDCEYKEKLLNEYSEKCINKNILNKLNKFDGDQLTIICYTILNNS